MNIIEKHINLNVSQPNDFELVCAMQNTQDSLKIIAKLYDANVPYIMDNTVSHVMLQGVSPCGMAILKEITEYTSTTASFLLSDNMLAVDGDLKLSIVITANSENSDNASKQIISTFPFKIRVIHAPIGEVQESEIDSIIKFVLKAEEYANESKTYGILSKSYAVGGTGTREDEENDNAKKYKQDAYSFAGSANLSERNARLSQEQAATSEINAGNSAAEASVSAINAAKSENSAKIHSSQANVSANDASLNATESSNSAILSKSYAIGGTNTRENENMDNSKFYYEQSKSISESISGALRPMGTINFSSLPSLSSVSNGDMYNISDEFTTTDDFKEGNGNIIPAGSNIYKTADGKWDVLAGTPVTGIKGNAESTYRKGNVNITPDNIGALPKNGTSAKTNAFHVPRVSKNPSYSPGVYTAVLEEFQSNCEGLPSSQYYHILTSQGGDNTYLVQLAMGMTVDDICFRNVRANAWGNWIHILHSGNVSGYTAGGSYRLQNITPPVTSPSNDTTAVWGSQNCVVTNYLSAGQLKGQPNTYGLLFNISNGGSEVFQLWRSQPGGSVFHRGGNHSGWEGSAADTGSWREFLDSGNYSSYAMPKSGGTFTGAIGVGTKVKLWTDGEGGNIQINSPDSYNKEWQMDAFNGNLRIYQTDKSTNSNYFPLSLTKDTLVANKITASGNLQANNMLITQVNDNETVSFKMGAKNNTNNSSYPCLWLRQFSNGFQFLPNSNNGNVYIGHQDYQFGHVYARNIYNSSGIITTSDKNKKHDIKDLESEFVEKIIDGLSAKSFKYNDGNSGRTHFGIIAQDLEKLLEELGISSVDFAPLVKDYTDKEINIGKDTEGNPITELQKDYDAQPIYNVRYEEFIMILVKYCQDLKKSIKDLQKDIESLKDKLLN